MEQTTGEKIQRPDAEAFSRILLYQLAALRAEGVETRNVVTKLLCHTLGENHAHYLKEIEDQEKRRAAETDRIYRNCLEAAKIPYKPFSKEQSQT